MGRFAMGAAVFLVVVVFCSLSGGQGVPRSSVFSATAPILPTRGAPGTVPTGFSTTATDSRLGTPEFYGGWVDVHTSAVAGVLQTGPGTPTFVNGEVKFRTGGAWLGIEEKIKAFGSMGGLLQGGILIPCAGSALETNAFSGNPFFPFVLGRRFDVEHNWWHVSGSVYWDVYPSFTVLGGFRYDFVDAHLKDASLIIVTTVVGPRPYSNPANTLDSTTQLYLPFVGFEVSHRDQVSDLVVRVCGFPWISMYQRSRESFPGPRNFVTSVTGEGYFAEIFLKYDRALSQTMRAGVFATAGVVHASVNDDLIADHVDPPTAYGLEFPLDLGYHRRYLTAGAMASLSFRLPW